MHVNTQQATYFEVVSELNQRNHDSAHPGSRDDEETTDEPIDGSAYINTAKCLTILLAYMEIILLLSKFDSKLQCPLFIHSFIHSLTQSLYPQFQRQAVAQRQ